MHFRLVRFCLPVFVVWIFTSCAPGSTPSAEVQMPEATVINTVIPAGFKSADGSRPLTFPADFGRHPDYQTEWWYYTGNLKTAEGRPFGFELTIFRVGLLAPNVELPTDSKWASREVYFAHFAVSDIEADTFHAFERYSRPGPGLAGAEADPYRVWLEDWSITEQDPGTYQLQAEQENIAIQLTLTDEMGIVLHGENGYSRKGKNSTNASYYYSQPRLRAEGSIKLNQAEYAVSGLAWKDHEFSTSVLAEDQIGWDWFSLQFEGGEALMLFQLRAREATSTSFSSGTWIAPDSSARNLLPSDFEISVLDTWRSPHTEGVYPSSWTIQLNDPDCVLDLQPWMADQEIHFSAVTYWEGAVRFQGTCDGRSVRGNGYVELTGYTGNLPLP